MKTSKPKKIKKKAETKIDKNGMTQIPAFGIQYDAHLTAHDLLMRADDLLPVGLRLNLHERMEIRVWNAGAKLIQLAQQIVAEKEQWKSLLTNNSETDTKNRGNNAGDKEIKK